MDERAFLEVAFCADSTWTNGCDPYQQANKLLLQKVLKSKSAGDNVESSLNPEDKMPPSSEDKSNVRSGAKTVRDVIPSSRLASYGNYEYNQVLESLYASDFSSAQYHFDCPKTDPEEVWMLQEVEDLFHKYTAPLSSGDSGFSSSVKSQTSKTQTEHDIDSFFHDKCTISTASERALAKRIRCDAVKRIWDTEIADTPCTGRTTNLPPGPPKQTVPNLDTKTSTQYVLARQYQLWGASGGADYVPVPVPIRDNPYSLFEYNEGVTTKKSIHFFPSSSEVSESSELFPYLEVGLPIPKHTPSYAIPVIQPSQQTRTHSSGSPPTVKKIPVYQRPAEQHAERRRHGADLSNLICLSKHEERRGDEEPSPPGVDADPEVSSEINWLLLNYHPRVTTFQQSSHLADELLVMERQMDEAVAAAAEAMTTSPERLGEPAGAKLELEKDFPPMSLPQKRLKTKLRKPSGPTPTPMAELAVDVSGPWGPRRTYKDVCLNETQLSPDSAGGFGHDGEDDDDDDDPLPDSIPESFWAPVVKGDLRGERGFVDHKEYWPALADPSLRRSPLKLDEVKEDESGMVSIQETKVTPGCLEVIEEVHEVEIGEKKADDAVGVVAQEVGVVIARPSDEDLANKYQGLEEQALETIAGIRKGDDVGQAQEESVDGVVIGVDLEKHAAPRASLLVVPRLDKASGVAVGESSSDDESPTMSWSTPEPEGGYVFAVGVEPRTHRRPLCPSPTKAAIVLKSPPKATVTAVTIPSPSSLPLTVSNAADVADTTDSTLSRVSSSTTLLEDSTSSSTKPVWLKQPRKKPPSRRKQAKPGTKPKPDVAVACPHIGATMDRNALLKIERELKDARTVACDLFLRCGRRVGNRRDANVGTESGARLDHANMVELLSHFAMATPPTAGHCPKCAWDIARALMPPECPSCQEKVGPLMERIQEHIRAMDATVWDAITSRIRTGVSYLTRLGEMVRSTPPWDCKIERFTNFYQIHNRTVTQSSPSFLDSILPALSYAYTDENCAPLCRWPRREETVCLRRTVFVSPGVTVILGYITSNTEDGFVSSCMHTTTFSRSGAVFSRSPLTDSPLPPPYGPGLSALSVLARLEGAVDHFLRTEASIMPPLTATAPAQSVATQTEFRTGKNRLKALSKQLFQPPPPAPKKEPPTWPTQPPAPPNTQPPAAADGGAGQCCMSRQPPCQHAARRQRLIARKAAAQAQATAAQAASVLAASAQASSARAKKKALVSHIPVPTTGRRRRKPQDDAGVQSDSEELEMTTASPEMRPPQPEATQSPPTTASSDQVVDQSEAAKFHSVTASVCDACRRAQLKPPVCCCRCDDVPRTSVPTPTPTPPATPSRRRSGPRETPHAHTGQQQPRESNCNPEPLRQATASLLQRGGRKQVGNVNGADVRPDVVVAAAKPQTSRGKAVKEVKKRLNSTMDEIQKLKRDNAEARCILERCSRMGASVGDLPGASRQEDGVELGRAGNGDATATPKTTSVLVASPDQAAVVGPELLGGQAGNGDATPTSTSTPKTTSVFVASPDQAAAVAEPQLLEGPRG